MKFSCTQENLNHGLNIISHLAVKNSNLPILNNILIKTSNSGILLSATNLEIGISCQVRAKVEKDGLFTVPATILANFISLLNKDEKIDVELINKELIIKSNNQQTKIKGEDASEFPIIPDVAKEQEIILNKELLKESLSQVIFATSTDETRVELSGVLFNFNKKELVLAATDSYRLAEKKIITNNNDLKQQIILPQRTAAELLRILPYNENEEIKIFLSENQIFFDLNQTTLTSRLIEGNYPDYQPIIPQNEKTKMIIEKDYFIKVVKRAALFSKSGINDIEINFDQTKQVIVIKAVSNQIGENINEQPAEIKGVDNNIVFNYRYLLDGLSNIQSEKVILKIVDNSSPGVIHGQEQDDYLYIIMPIKQ